MSESNRQCGSQPDAKSKKFIPYEFRANITSDELIALLCLREEMYEALQWCIRGIKILEADIYPGVAEEHRRTTFRANAEAVLAKAEGRSL